MLCNNLPTLLWLGQLADLALHTSLARANAEPDGQHLGTDFSSSKEALEASLLNHPDFVLFDLDPYIYAGYEGKGEEPELNRAAFHRTVQVAQWLKELLDSASLSSFVKTSGATGCTSTCRSCDGSTTRRSARSARPSAPSCFVRIRAT